MTSRIEPLQPKPAPPNCEIFYPSGTEDRRTTLEGLLRIASPVLQAAAEGRLKRSIPVNPWEGDLKRWAAAEAFARVLAGISPWLELGPDDSPEGIRRQGFLELTRQAIHSAFDPASPDFMDWGAGAQMLVEGAFFSEALLRAPTQLWESLPPDDRERILSGLKRTRAIKPYENNWLLFSAMVEAVLWKLSGEFERTPIEKAVKKHMDWYVGDGTYGDGPQFHWDYYNSYVIHPMLLDILNVCQECGDPLGNLLPAEIERARRYAQIQERMISPEGTFPVIGRSSTYRFGAFHLLSQMFLLRQAPENLDPGATRSALTTVIGRMLEGNGTFDENGWLRLGAVGFQPELRDVYNSTGSPYLAATGLIHLGLPAEDPFWTAPGGPWTQRVLWSGDPSARADKTYKGG